MDINQGDLIRKPYPFKICADQVSFGLEEHDFIEYWRGGCNPTLEDQYAESAIYEADGEGEIEYEVLAVVEMPRNYQPRVIYRISMIDPEGVERKSSKDYTVTMSKFLSWVNAEHSSYPYHYEVASCE